jgi:hypothetical protein
MQLLPGEEYGCEQGGYEDVGKLPNLFEFRAETRLAGVKGGNLAASIAENVLARAMPDDSLRVTDKELPGTTKPPSTQPSTNARILRDIARVICSQNAGPFEITLDVMFETCQPTMLSKTRTS